MENNLEELMGLMSQGSPPSSQQSSPPNPAVTPAVSVVPAVPVSATTAQSTTSTATTVSATPAAADIRRNNQLGAAAAAQVRTQQAQALALGLQPGQALQSTNPVANAVTNPAVGLAAPNTNNYEELLFLVNKQKAAGAPSAPAVAPAAAGRGAPDVRTVATAQAAQLAAAQATSQAQFSAVRARSAADPVTAASGPAAIAALAAVGPAQPIPGAAGGLNDITAELEVLIAPQPAAPVAVAAAPVAVAAAPRHMPHRAPLPPGGVSVTPAGRGSAARPPQDTAAAFTARQQQAAQQRASMMAATAGGGDSQQTKVSQVQVVVGHFCRHAIKTLVELMAGKPNKDVMEAQLRNNIKILWTQWVRGAVNKTEMLKQISLFVRKSTPEAANVDVLGQFKTWYQLQLEQQQKLRLVAKNNAARPPTAGHASAPATANGAVPNGAARPPNTPQEAALLATRAAAMQAQMSQARKPVPTPAGAGRGAVPNGNPSPASANPSPASASPGVASLSPASASPGVASLSSGGSVQSGKAGGKQPAPTSNGALPPSLPKPASAVVAAAAAAAASRPVPKTAAGKTAPNGTAGNPTAKKPRPAPKRKAPKASNSQASQGAAAGKQSDAAGAGSGPRSGLSGPGEPPKKARKVDDELDIVRGIVDIEGEENMLVNSQTEGNLGADTSDFDSRGMMLTGSVLKEKLGSICARQGLDENVPTETMEIIAVAVRHRLASMFEELGEIAKTRTGADLHGWKTQPVGINQLARMQQMREQEQRALEASAEVRRDRAAKAAAKLASDGAAEMDKSAKDAAASADAKSKAQALKEKERNAAKTQRNALLKVMGTIGKKSKSKGDSASKKSGGSKGSGLKVGSNANGAGSLNGSKGAGSGTSKGGGSSDGKNAASSGGATGKANGSGVTPMDGVEMAQAGKDGNSNPGSGGLSRPPRPPITLRDCLHFMEGDPRVRKGALLYRWYAKLGKDKPPLPNSGRKK